MTLACLAGDDKAWSEIEQAWDKVRKDRGNPAYMHMNEAMSLSKEFENWKAEARDFLVDGFLGVFSEFRNHPRLFSFSCTVDLVAHERWKLLRQHPPPARLCARVVFGHCFHWFQELPSPILDNMEFYFDRNELYMRHVYADWKSRRIRQQHPIWELVRTIAPAVMEITPALQMVDMIGWGRNRLAATGTNWRADPLYPAALRSCSTIRFHHRIANEETLSSAAFPAEGVDRINPQRKKVRALLIRPYEPER
jgi:hypothetical protein